MNRIEGSRFLVTGGAGFIGSTIVDQLVAAGATEVRIIDNFVRGTWTNLAQAQKSGRVEIVEGDIGDVALVNRLTQGVDYVFHEAALRITRCAESPRDGVEVLIVGTLNVLEACVTHKVKKIIAASSASVYGNPSYLPIDEAHPFNNRTLYGAGKIAEEQLLRAFYTSYGLP
jgi:UDP-glucose 4-epimerase